MIKILIADDEEKICQLIEFLVNWEALGMKVVSMAHNGIQALEMIKEYQPDITITDIKMPGCDGLEMIEQAKAIVPGMEFIIISGYRQFDYAQRAIKFGVYDYLLKPIDQKELNATLEKMNQRYWEKNEQSEDKKKIKLYEKDDRVRARKLLFHEILMRKKVIEPVTDINDLNDFYQYDFKEGLFQTAIIKIDGLAGNTEDKDKYLEKKIIQILNNHLQQCYEWECVCNRNICYLLLNYPKELGNVHKAMRKILEELLLQENIFHKMQVTIGYGNSCNSIIKLADNFKSARWALAQRLISGTNQIIKGEAKSANDFADSTIFNEFNKRLYTAIEVQSVDQIREVVAYLKENIIKNDTVSGYEILQMTKEAMNFYMLTLKNLQFPMTALEGVFEEYKMEVDNFGSMNEVLEYLSNTLVSTFHKVLEEKKDMDTKPIRLAKQYIAKNYMNPISLEITSEMVGFNTAYFSSMFKRETGINFSEYLLEKRMEGAKELLKETKIPVSSICEKVGYSDVKYFTKKFTQYTSLKPNEYRKLYS